MNKLVLSLLVSAVAVNAFGMELSIKSASFYDHKVELAKQDVAMAKAIFYPILGTAAVGIAGYFGSWMWYDYMKYREKVAQTSTNSGGTSRNSSWAPYAKIAAGLGLTGLTAYLGMKQPAQAQSMMTQYEAHSNNGGVGPTLSPQIMISFGSLYTLAPMIPAYFFLKSGFDDLKKS